MDILYYSNYCKHSQKVLQTLGKTNVVDKISFICIDKRSRDPKSNQMYIDLENGSKVIMPPNLHSVPAMLLVKQQYRVIYGTEILEYLQPKLKMEANLSAPVFDEPMAYQLNGGSGGSNIVSEHFTMYDMTPDELSSKGKGSNRQMYNYVSANDNVITINTPPENYRPDKISNNVTIDTLQEKRNNEINRGSNTQGMMYSNML
uniref:Glutaredoxin domain-containing protein n=1 Tax=viral metagenome TaxID=1070528 RepID=A0A6C0DUJ9_9ZZZZ